MYGARVKSSSQGRGNGSIPLNIRPLTPFRSSSDSTLSSTDSLVSSLTHINPKSNRKWVQEISTRWQQTHKNKVSDMLKRILGFSGADPCHWNSKANSCLWVPPQLLRLKGMEGGTHLFYFSKHLTVDVLEEVSKELPIPSLNSLTSIPVWGQNGKPERAHPDVMNGKLWNGTSGQSLSGWKGSCDVTRHQLLTVSKGPTGSSQIL